MKSIAFIIICCAMSAFTFANQFQMDTQLHVVAHAGLNLRVEPHMMSDVISLLEYGEQVELVEIVENSKTKINWVEGQWIKVRTDDFEGYVFDGFVSPLAIPTYSFEQCPDMNLTSTLEAWVQFHLIPIENTDTLSRTSKVVMTSETFLDGNKMVKTEKEHSAKIDLHLSNVRIMDAYHLLKGMITDDGEQKAFQDASVFIENEHGKIGQIKIKGTDTIDIRKMHNDQIRIRTYSSKKGASI